MRISFQGEPGAFGDIAIQQHWSGEAESVSAPSFGATLDLVTSGECAMAVLPVWNTTIGDVAEAVAAARERDGVLEACGEVTMPVRHALIALPGASLESVRWVGSHFAALGQCARFLTEHPAYTAIKAFDTAGAVRELSTFGAGASPSTWFAQLNAEASQLASIAHAGAAARYGLQVLQDAIQDDPQNATRFNILRRRATT